MARPNTFRQNVQEKARKAINRKFERASLTDGDLDRAFDAFATHEYNAFFKDCREAGHPTERCGALWNRLKERGNVPTPDPAAPDDPTDDADVSDDRVAAGPPTPDDGAPEPETLDDLEAELAEADAVYLITTTGCPSCAAAKDALKDWLDAGLVTEANVQESDLGADIVMEQGIDALPAMVIESDGERLTI